MHVQRMDVPMVVMFLRPVDRRYDADLAIAGTIPLPVDANKLGHRRAMVGVVAVLVMFGLGGERYPTHGQEKRLEVGGCSAVERGDGSSV